MAGDSLPVTTDDKVSDATPGGDTWFNMFSAGAADLNGMVRDLRQFRLMTFMTWGASMMIKSTTTMRSRPLRVLWKRSKKPMTTRLQNTLKRTKSTKTGTATRAQSGLT